jgi:hypothetical protein
MRYLVPILTAGAVLTGAAGASAQVVDIEFGDGRVELIAENVTASRILDEWARVGRTTVVNGERVSGPPVTLQLIGVPEREALDVILRDHRS